MAVTESKGDGYALYNGVKLPNIDAVWTDKEKYPYAYIANVKFTDGTETVEQLVLYLTDSNARKMQSLDGLLAIPTLSSVQTYTLDGDMFVLENSSEQTEVMSIVQFVQDENNRYFAIWASTDIKGEPDETIYFAASSPIPLDGMNVIEWDGVTEGLEVAEIGYCRLTNYTKAQDAVAVARLPNGETATVDTFNFFEATEKEPESWNLIEERTGSAVVAANKTDDFGMVSGIWCILLGDGNGNVGSIVIAYTPATTEPEEPEEPEEPAEPTERSLYSYNGTTFPNIDTVWTNKTTYPYAVLTDNGHLLLLTKRPYYDSVNGRYRWPSESFTTSTFVHIGNGWKFELTNVDVSFPENISMATPLWLNVDCLTETGEVYQATTEPVYIGEADPVPEAESYYLYSVYFGSTFNVKHEIPALPYWDKEKYPYYLIAESNVFKKSYFERFYEFVLAISTEPFYEKSTYYPATDVTENQILVPSQNTEVKLCWYRYDYPGFVWSPFILKEPVIENGTWKYTVKFFTSDVILSNVNILDSNGYICAGLNQLLPVPTKLENFICGYIAGLSGGHTEFRDNTWPIRFEYDIVKHNQTFITTEDHTAYKISDVVIPAEQMEQLTVWWTDPGYEADKFSLIGEVKHYANGCHAKFGTVFLYSYSTAGEDTVSGHTVPEPGTYASVFLDVPGFCSIYPPDKEPIAYLYNGVRLPKLP